MKWIEVTANKRGLRAPFSVRVESGFTVVELIVTIVLIGIMSAVFAPRFLGQSEFQVATAKNELLSVARFAQQAALWRGIGARVQLVFDDPDSVAFPEIKVQVISLVGPDDELGTADDVPAGCVGTVGTVIRSIPMTKGKAYLPILEQRWNGSSWSGDTPPVAGPAPYLAVVQYNTLGALDSQSTDCPSLVKLDLASNPDSEHGDICIEPSGYAHEGACYCDPSTAGATAGNGCNI